LFFSEPRRRKSRKQKAKEKGRSYRKGEQFEKKAYIFLRSKGFRAHKERIRFKAGEMDVKEIEQARPTPQGLV